MHSQIRDIGVGLPDTVESNDQLASQNPHWNLELVGQRSGVQARRLAAPDQTALDLAQTACQSLLGRHAGLAEKVDALLFCTQTPDHIIPSNACILSHRLGLPEQVMAYDVGMACSGFVYLLLQADALIRSGRAQNVLLVNADTYSKLIHPRDRSARVLFGDGAAATWISGCEPPRGVRDVLCGTQGALYDKFVVPAGGCRLPRSAATAVEVTNDDGNVHTAETIHMAGKEILAFVNTKIPKHIHQLLERNQCGVGDVDLFVFHQASAMVLDCLTRFLRLREDQVFRNLNSIGNTVSASIPIALHDALASGHLARGQRIVTCGFGAGLSWASALVDY